MKQVIEKEFCCRKCGSPNIVLNGHNSSGNQQYHCNNCGFYGVLQPTCRYSEERKEEIIRAYQERASMRGIERIFGVARQTLAKWIKKKWSNYLTFCKHLYPVDQMI